MSIVTLRINPPCIAVRYGKRSLIHASSRAVRDGRSRSFIPAGSRQDITMYSILSSFFSSIGRFFCNFQRHPSPPVAQRTITFTPDPRSDVGPNPAMGTDRGSGTIPGPLGRDTHISHVIKGGATVIAGSSPRSSSAAATAISVTPACAGAGSLERGGAAPEKTIDVFKKMQKNAQKAIKEHVDATSLPSGTKLVKSEKGCYATQAEIDASIESTPATALKSLTQGLFQAQGLRPTMEDAHGYVEMEKGTLALVLDGHGGSEVANYAAKQFSARFPAKLKELGGNVRQAFEMLIDEIQAEIASAPAWQYIGSTAVICYVDKERNLVYTATMGDSEANLYRKFPTGYKSIPLSCVRDWSSKKDAERAERATGRPGLKAMYTDPKCNPKTLRVKGLNVSRGFGDTSLGAAASHKPKITVQTMLPGDILTLVCDGVKDYAAERDLLTIVAHYESGTPDRIARAIGEKALSLMTRDANDNVSAMVFKAS